MPFFQTGTNAMVTFGGDNNDSQGNQDNRYIVYCAMFGLDDYLPHLRSGPSANVSSAGNTQATQTK